MLVSGAVLAGLVAVAVGGVWGYALFRKSESAGRVRTVWENRRICLACTEQWTP